MPGRRGRGLELWKQAGKLLGVGGYANGGFVGGSSMYSANSNSYSDTLSYLNLYSVGTETSLYEGLKSTSSSWDYGVTNNGRNDNDITIQINMNPSFDIQGSSSEFNNEDRVLNTIKSHLGEMADELSCEIATTLEQIFQICQRKD